MMNMGGAPNAPQLPPPPPQGGPGMPPPGMMGAPAPPPPPPQPVDPGMLFAAQETLKKPTWDDVLGLFHNDRLRSFTIDIETDSTIAADDVAEKQSVTEFVGILGNFMSTMLPVTQAHPELAPLSMEILKYASRRYKAGRQLETVIDETTDKILEKAAHPPAAPQDPKLESAQMLANAKIQQGQDQIQIERERSAAQVDLKHQEAAANIGLRQAQAQADANLEMSKAQTDAEIAALKVVHQPPKVM